jgi:hypothetical protein
VVQKVNESDCAAGWNFNHLKTDDHSASLSNCKLVAKRYSEELLPVDDTAGGKKLPWPLIILTFPVDQDRS